ncbi:uncharacterized protein LOC121875587 [Homarus americanus]|uniref:uncharacterized protein LOC121875587 n=1 Tax=Homarus americanus TaxID=6706 RepID=UPI001C4736D9|nr:uncharacterized protein LOC121875587 [Homarus americanus]
MSVFSSCLTLFAIIGTAMALQCYVCNNVMDSACNDEFSYDSPALKAAFIKNCSDEIPALSGDNETIVDVFCRKTKLYVDRVELNGSIRLHRDCGYNRREGADCYQKRAEDYVQQVCQCNGDFCNGSPALTFSLAPVLLALTLPFFARYL